MSQSNRRLKDIPYTVEHFYRFHVKLNRQGLPDPSSVPKWFWFNYSNTGIGRLLKQSTSLSSPRSLAPWVNISVFRPYPRKGISKGYYPYFYPKHIATLHPRHQEYLKCELCQSSIVVYRHTPRYSPRVSRKYSSYHPQPARTCDCKQLAVIVDHRGLLRVYTKDIKNVSLQSVMDYYYDEDRDSSLTIPLDTPLPLDLAQVKELPTGILDGPKFISSPLEGSIGKYIDIYTDRAKDSWASMDRENFNYNTQGASLNTYKLFQMVNHVNVSHHIAPLMESFLKFPIPKLSDIQGDSDYIKYSSMYSRVFNIIVHTAYGIHFPAGLSLSSKHPLYTKLVNQKISKEFYEDNYDSLRATRFIIKDSIDPASYDYYKNLSFKDILTRPQISQGILRLQNSIYQEIYQQYLAHAEVAVNSTEFSQKYFQEVNQPLSYYPFQLSGYLLAFIWKVRSIRDQTQLKRPLLTTARTIRASPFAVLDDATFKVYKKQEKLYVHEKYHLHLQQTKLLVTQVLRFVMMQKSINKSKKGFGQLPDRIRQNVLTDKHINALRQLYIPPPVFTANLNRIFGVQPTNQFYNRPSYLWKPSQRTLSRLMPTD